MWFLSSMARQTPRICWVCRSSHQVQAAQFLEVHRCRCQALGTNAEIFIKINLEYYILGCTFEGVRVVGGFFTLVNLIGRGLCASWVLALDSLDFLVGTSSFSLPPLFLTCEYKNCYKIYPSVKCRWSYWFGYPRLFIFFVVCVFERTNISFQSPNSHSSGWQEHLQFQLQGVQVLHGHTFLVVARQDCGFYVQKMWNFEAAVILWLITGGVSGQDFAIVANFDERERECRLVAVGRVGRVGQNRRGCDGRRGHFLLAVRAGLLLARLARLSGAPAAHSTARRRLLRSDCDSRRSCNAYADGNFRRFCFFLRAENRM